MTLDKDERIFLIPVGTKYAEFRFKPYKIMEELLNEYNIEYQMSKKRFSGVLLVNSRTTSLKYYNVPCKTISNKKYYFFAFTSNIIDKVLKYYKIDYSKK